MNIKYFWQYENQKLVPTIDFESIQDGFKGLIFYFLKDDEGLGLDYLKEWIVEGFAKIEYVRLGEFDYFDMWGQAWGAEVTQDQVLIYWGYDENISEERMSFKCFHTIIKNWKDFLFSKPSSDYIMEFETK